MSKKYKYQKFFRYEGKRYAVYGDTLDEVYEKKAKKLLDLKENRVLVSGSMLVKDWVPVCIETYKPNLSEGPREEFEKRVDKYIVGELGSMRLRDVTPLQCQRIMSAQSGMSKSHIEKLRQAMVFIFEKAQKNHYIFENPASGMIIPKGSEGHRRSLTEEERKAFLEIEYNKDGFLLFSFMLYCGCRPGEAINLLRSDIYSVDGVNMLHIRGTKTERSDRIVPIPDHLYDRVKDASPDSPLVLTDKGTLYKKQSYKRLSDRLRREMNIAMGCEMYRNALIPPLPLADDFVPYMFRHTYCTDLQKAGIDVRVAQRLMGHASIEITANIYTHVDQSEIVKAAAILSGFQNGN